MAISLLSRNTGRHRLVAMVSECVFLIRVPLGSPILQAMFFLVAPLATIASCFFPVAYSLLLVYFFTHFFFSHGPTMSVVVACLPWTKKCRMCPRRSRTTGDGS